MCWKIQILPYTVLMPYTDLEKRRAAVRRHYAAHPDYYRERNRKLKRDNTSKIRETKNVPCADCGQSYPYYVMDFDHRPDENKKFELGRIVHRSSTRKQVAEEIAKCDVVCSNCHRERTFKRSQIK